MESTPKPLTQKGFFFFFPALHSVFMELNKVLMVKQELDKGTQTCKIASF